ncbi:MAG: G5 domain-containing protein [Anaerolineae bacterium]|nr:G5 domain-containing protein [Anaerolineae bacterium]
MNPRVVRHSANRLWLVLAGCALALAALVMLAACTGPSAATITIAADGEERAFSTTAATVNQALKEAGVTLGPMDRVSPPSWTSITPGLRIVVVRVAEEMVVQTQPIPYSRKIIHDEALPAGEHRLIQAGKEGVEELTYRIVREDGVKMSRNLVKRSTAVAPVDEILVVGSKGSLPPVEFKGTIAYISSRNAWVMRENSEGRRPLTAEGDLDRHVFSLSRDGRLLLYSRENPKADDPVFNSLWVITTTVKGVAPAPLGIENVLWAEWSPAGDAIAFSTGERAAGIPGWKARNDLWIARAPAFTATQVLSPTANIFYPWWGTTYTWAPDGTQLAYANAGEVGVVDVSTGTRRRLVQFAPFDSRSTWVWVPGVSWSPDSRFIATVVHGYSGTGLPEESPLFDLWILSADGTMVVPIARDVGMWANPAWSPWTDAARGQNAILFGVAENPAHSQLSLYELHVMDRDGSNRRKVFPPAGERGVDTVEIAWSPDGRAAALVFQGDLYLLNPESGQARQLTADGNSSRVCWAK